MMRRIVDATIPALSLVAVAPVAVRIVDLPMTIRESLGLGLGVVWAFVVGLAMLFVTVGIILRPNREVAADPANVHRAAWSFKFEFSSLLVAGSTSAMYGVALFSVAGFRGWTAAWFVWAIGAHCLARFAELSRARRVAKRVSA